MYFKKIITTSILMLFMAGTVLAQDVTLNIQGQPQMHIDGEANVRSWDAAVEQVEGTLVMAEVEEMMPENLSADLFKEMTLTIPVESIQSGSGGLTKNIHKYLNADDHPNITFTLNEVNEISVEDESAIITASGVVNANGVDSDVTLQVTASMNADGSINFQGEQELLMTSFDIDPPTAIFGTVRARDEMIISYNVNFN
ncbi:YceI family protein [Rhodohalobacter sp.]|uniref:YceI family protein n=1 Tax=Rhodohalobacter sp. TaxID=1974210 RepID=UPI0035638D27